MKTDRLEIATQSQAVQQIEQDDPLGNTLAVISRAARDPNCDVEKMERLLAMAERMEARRAEKEFIAAFNRLQRKLPTIVAKTVIPNRGKYERFEDVMFQIGPLIQEEGFAVSFSMDFKDNRIIETCYLKHTSGHSQSNSFAVRSGGKAESDTQADCKAATTAKRNALLNALNIVIRQDCLSDESDAAIEGDPNAKLTQAQADELEHRAQLTNSNIPALLRFAGSATFKDIPANKYAELDSMLRRKEQGGR